MGTANFFVTAGGAIGWQDPYPSYGGGFAPRSYQQYQMDYLDNWFHFEGIVDQAAREDGDDVDSPCPGRTPETAALAIRLANWLT